VVIRDPLPRWALGLLLASRWQAGNGKDDQWLADVKRIKFPRRNVPALWPLTGQDVGAGPSATDPLFEDTYLPVCLIAAA